MIRTRTRFLLLTIVSGLAVVIAGIGIGIYVFAWQSPPVRAALQVIPLPAATVGWYPIRAVRFLEQESTLARYQSALRRTSPANFPVVPPEERRRQALDQLIRDRATWVLAAEHGVNVTSVDIDQAFTAQLAQGGSRAATAQVLEDFYGWTPDEFKRHVLRAAVARAKLREQLSFDPQFNQTARQQAERVLALVQAGEQSFSELAKTYSQDSSADSGGDLGWIRRGEQMNEIEDAAFELAIGQVSELIHTKFGFHIIKLEEDRTIEDERQLRIRQIFIPTPAVDAIITDYLKKHQVWVWWPGLDWDNEKGRVVIPGS